MMLWTCTSGHHIATTPLVTADSRGISVSKRWQQGKAMAPTCLPAETHWPPLLLANYRPCGNVSHAAPARAGRRAPRDAGANTKAGERRTGSERWRIIILPISDVDTPRPPPPKFKQQLAVMLEEKPGLPSFARRLDSLSYGCEACGRNVGGAGLCEGPRQVASNPPSLAQPLHLRACLHAGRLLQTFLLSRSRSWFEGCAGQLRPDALRHFKSFRSKHHNIQKALKTPTAQTFSVFPQSLRCFYYVS